MLTESIVVVVLTLIISYLYLRRGRQGIAASILPVGVLPLVCVLGYLLRERLPSVLPAAHWGILIVMVGLVAGGSLFGIISSNIHRKSARRVYLLVCGGFTVLFAFMEILTIVQII